MRKLVVGLGNPGPRYAATRHNVGVRIAEALVRRLGGEFGPSGFDGRLARTRAPARAEAGSPGPPGAPTDVWVLCPETFMNRSGRSVAAALAAAPDLAPGRDLLVLLDDLDLPFGRLRLRAEGGAGGHNGLADVIDAVGDRRVPRLRFGIGRPPPGEDPVEYVLAPFSRDEEDALPERIGAAVDGVLEALRDGVEAAMGRVNRRPDAPEAVPPEVES